jgi:hypothetical protein
VVTPPRRGTDLVRGAAGVMTGAALRLVLMIISSRRSGADAAVLLGATTMKCRMANSSNACSSATSRRLSRRGEASGRFTASMRAGCCGGRDGGGNGEGGRGR